MDVLKQLVSLENQATAFGFKWENPQQIMAQIQSECDEINVHLKDKDQAKLQEEIGDLMHAVFSLSVFCKIDPQETLAGSVDKFARRFKAVQQLAREQGFESLENQSFEKIMLLWDKAKQDVG